MLSLCSWNYVDTDFWISSAYVALGMKDFLILEHSSLRWGKQKKHKKKVFTVFSKRNQFSVKKNEHLIVFYVDQFAHLVVCLAYQETTADKNF